MGSVKIRPESPDVHLELIEAERSYAFQQGIKMILEPTPDLASGDALRGRRVYTDGLLDGGKVRHLTDRADHRGRR